MLGKRRRSELELFQKNAAGEYVYTGSHYRYAGSGGRKRQFIKLWLLGGCGAAALLAAGFLPAPGSTGCFYVLIPYVAALVAVISALWALGRLTLGGDPIREPIYDSASVHLPRRWAASGILEILAMAGEVLFLILHGAGDRPGVPPAYLALLGIAAGCGTLCGSQVRRMTWDKIS